MQKLIAIDDIPEALGIKIGRNKLYSLLNSGQIKAKKFGKKTVVTAEALDAFVKSLPDYSPDSPEAIKAAMSAKGIKHGDDGEGAA